MFPVYEDKTKIEAGNYKRASALGKLRDDLSSEEESDTPAEVTLEQPKEDLVVEQPKQSRVDVKEINSLREKLIALENHRFEGLRTLLEDHFRLVNKRIKDINAATAKHFISKFDESTDIPYSEIPSNSEDYLDDLRERVLWASKNLQQVRERIRSQMGG